MNEVSYWLEIKTKQGREDGDMVPEGVFEKRFIQIWKTKKK